MKLEYRHKKSRKYTATNYTWKNCSSYVNNVPSSIDWRVFDFRLNGKVYTSLTKKFNEEFSKYLIWKRLNET